MDITSPPPIGISLVLTASSTGSGFGRGSTSESSAGSGSPLWRRRLRMKPSACSQSSERQWNTKFNASSYDSGSHQKVGSVHSPDDSDLLIPLYEHSAKLPLTQNSQYTRTVHSWCLVFLIHLSWPGIGNISGGVFLDLIELCHESQLHSNRPNRIRVNRTRGFTIWVVWLSVMEHCSSDILGPTNNLGFQKNELMEFITPSGTPNFPNNFFRPRQRVRCTPPRPVLDTV